MKRVHWKDAPRDGASRFENVGTQPRARHRVFDNPEVVTEAWYPVCASSALARGETASFLLGRQRVALFRGATDGAVRALDAFCPHMGADLGNGRVVGDQLECYFHQWRFDGAGRLCGMRAGGELPGGVKNDAYPVEEKYGLVWIFAGAVAPYPVPDCAGLEGQPVVAWQLATPTLFAHHHVMMAGGIDLQHFASVHDLDVKFELSVEQVASSAGPRSDVADWKLEGEIPKSGWRGRLGRWLIGDRFRYVARFAGGSIVALTYGVGARWRGRALKPLYILWGCVAEPSGVSKVRVILVAARGAGLVGALSARFRLLLTAVLLMVLRDDDVKAFPNMRFQAGRLIAADGSVARFIQWVNRLPISKWSSRAPSDAPPSADE